jgi:hypothetical protein
MEANMGNNRDKERRLGATRGRFAKREKMQRDNDVIVHDKKKISKHLNIK